MNGDLAGYLLVLLIGLVLTIADGQVLIRAGRGFLSDVFENRETASSLSTMLVVFFHLLVLGILALVSTFDVGAESFVELIVKKTGWILIVLAVVHAITMIVLFRLRRLWREQQLVAAASAQIQHPETPTVAPAPPGPQADERAIQVAPPQW